MCWELLLSMTKFTLEGPKEEEEEGIVTHPQWPKLWLLLVAAKTAHAWQWSSVSLLSDVESIISTS